MPQWLEALTAAAKGPGSIPSSTSICNPSSRVSYTLFWLLRALHPCGAHRHIHADKTPMPIKSTGSLAVVAHTFNPSS